MNRRYSAPYAYFASAWKRSLALARSWLRLGRTFAERGGYLLTDLTPFQFTIRGDEIYLIDAPRPHSGPVADYYDAHHPEFRRANYPMDNATCAADEDCPTTKEFHCCCASRGVLARHASGKVCSLGSRGAPESQGICVAGRCATLSAKTNVFDWANRNWILDHIIALAPRPEGDLLRGLKARMSAWDPADRPTFSELLADLDRGASALRQGVARQ